MAGAPKKLILGSRESPLAKVQAETVRRAMLGVHPQISIEIHYMKTSGDKFLSTPLLEIGGKGLFTKELEQALLDGEIDLAIHSMKDVPEILPQGLALSSILEREDPADAFVSEHYTTLSTLPAGSRIGTSSFRRQLLLKKLYPALKVVPVRGNLQTRLRKMHSDKLAGLILAYAGLERMGLKEGVKERLKAESFLPALSQGILGLEYVPERLDLKLYSSLIDLSTERAFRCERAFLQALFGNCRSPIAGLAESWPDGAIRFRAVLLSPFAEHKDCYFEAKGEDPITLGQLAAHTILAQGGAALLKALTP